MAKVTTVPTRTRMKKPHGNKTPLAVEPSVSVGSTTKLNAKPKSKRSALPKRFRDHTNEPMFAASLIRPDRRPMFDIVNGTYTQTDDRWPELETPEIRERLERAIKAVGRIESAAGTIEGSGFVIGTNQIMTNRHVAEAIGGFNDQGDFVFNNGANPRINFLRENGAAAVNDNAGSYEIVAADIVHPYFDVAVFRVTALPSGVAPLVLASDPQGALGTRRFAAIGYPGFDPNEEPADQQRLTGGVYNVKRLAPGIIMALQRVSISGRSGLSLGHDSSLLKGSSGSPLVSLETGKVVGVHFNGRTSNDNLNWACPAAEMACDARLRAKAECFDGPGYMTQVSWETWWTNREDDGALMVG